MSETRKWRELVAQTLDAETQRRAEAETARLLDELARAESPSSPTEPTA